jgi:acetylornithine deacetylase
VSFLFIKSPIKLEFGSPFTMKTSILLLSALSTLGIASPANLQQPIGLTKKPASPTSELLDFHKELITHQSITGDEYSVGKFLVAYLESQNFTVETQEVTPGTASQSARFNILAYLGSQRETKTLVSSHIDTVPPYWEYEQIGNEIWGRGSVDAKGSLASQVFAVQALRPNLTEGDVALLYVVGEETGGDGMRVANDLGLSWSTVIFGEPTELKLASGHKGSLGVQIKARGKAGHSGYPELGRNANSMLVKALAGLETIELPSSDKFGNTTINLGLLKGGVAANVIGMFSSCS